MKTLKIEIVARFESDITEDDREEAMQNLQKECEDGMLSACGNWCESFEVKSEVTE